MRNGMYAAAAAALALAACGGGGSQGGGGQSSAGGDEANVSVGNTADPAAMNTSGAAAQPGVPATGQDYARMAAASDMFEIESSRLAQQKGQNADVKEFAQMLIADHQKSTTELKAAAQQAQPAITVTPQLDPEQQANMQALQQASGAEFDRLYLQQQVPAHEKALAMVEGYAQNGDVPSLKQHAQTVSGPIRQHLERARTLQQQGGGGQPK